MVRTPLRHRIIQFDERTLQDFLEFLARLEVRLPATGNEYGLVRLGISRLRLRLGLLHFKNAEIAELNSYLRVRLEHKFAQGRHNGSNPRLALINRFIHQLGYTPGDVLLRQGSGLRNHQYAPEKASSMWNSCSEVRGDRCGRNMYLGPDRKGSNYRDFCKKESGYHNDRYLTGISALSGVLGLLKTIHPMDSVNALYPSNESMQVFKIANVQHNRALENAILRVDRDGSDIRGQVL